mgnify:CR=1 FL=1
MPDGSRPRSIADLPPQQARQPRSDAEARGRFFNTGNGFDVRNPPVPDHLFVDEARRALDPATPTGLIACDISGILECPFPATSPLVLARYARIRAGDSLAADFAASGAIHYAIAGAGTTGCAGETIEWEAGDVFYMPPNLNHRHVNKSADKPARLLQVEAWPLMVYLGISELIQKEGAGPAPAST